MKLHMVLIALASLVASCGGRTPSHPTTPALASFTTGTWNLQIDRAWDGKTGAPQFPADALDESAYKRVTDGATYRLEVADDGRQVSVSDVTANPGAYVAFTGRRGKATESSVQYDFDSGGAIFAGARLVVWQATGGLQGEWTIFGSGVPIVKSERGPVVATR